MLHVVNLTGGLYTSSGEDFDLEGEFLLHGRKKCIFYRNFGPGSSLMSDPFDPSTSTPTFEVTVAHTAEANETARGMRE